MKISRQQEIDCEICRQAVRLEKSAPALLELYLMVYAKIIDDNAMRRSPYRVSFERVQNVIRAMPEFQ